MIIKHPTFNNGSPFNTKNIAGNKVASFIAMAADLLLEAQEKTIHHQQEKIEEYKKYLVDYCGKTLADEIISEIEAEK